MMTGMGIINLPVSLGMDDVGMPASSSFAFTFGFIYICSEVVSRWPAHSLAAGKKNLNSFCY
jgi:hypothetical protein